MTDSGPSQPIIFNVVHNDGWVQVVIENDFATLRVGAMNDVGVLIRAINKAAEFATRGTMFSGDVVNDEEANKSTWRSINGSTWMGGKVTRLPDSPEGPQFRIDWDVFPTVTR